jgi:hypothetical protein
VSLKLYLDEHVPAAVTRGLRGRGVDVRTVQDDGRTGHSDSLVLDRATELARVVFSRDSDLLALARRRQQEGIEFFGVVFAHPLRVPIGQCIVELELLAVVSDPDDMINRVEYLPLQ